MSNFYLDLTAKIIEKTTSSSGKFIVARQEIKFIAEQLRREQDIDAQIDSAFCYYVAGYYVQAMYVAQRVNLNKLGFVQKWMILFLRKDFQEFEQSLNTVITNSEYEDKTIKEEIQINGLSDIDVVGKVIDFKIAEAMMGILDFIKKGDRNKVQTFLEVVENCQRLIFKSGGWVTWWRLECLRMVVGEFVESSLWTTLRSFSSDDLIPKLIEEYIIANYHKERKIIELWRTQVESLPKINDVDRCSFCISVPTSGGKTLVAELAILRFLLDYQGQPDAICVYIAPFRKLALEVEISLLKSFGSGNEKMISVFYGGREIDVLDQHKIEDARIFVVTPEKLDSMLRQYPDLLSKIRLVIADEGHLIGERNGRSNSYRLLLERLIYKVNLRKSRIDKNSRVILVSGVLPNIENFADLISGDRSNVVKINWRPLGEPQISTWHWTGQELRLFHPRTSTVKNLIPYPSSCFSPDNTFEQITVKHAISYALTRPTMVFSASAKAVSSESLLDLLVCIANELPFNAQPLDKNIHRLKGYEKHYSLLEKGIAIHYKDLPRVLKKVVENRIDSGQIQLLFTSPTLAQGVNVPFEVVIVYKLQHYPGNPITDSTFWNVVGRAGRPILKSSTLDAPEILFFLNLSFNSKSQDQIEANISKNLLENRTRYQVASPFLDFLLTIKNKWQETTAKPIAELVSNLSEKKNLNDIVGEITYSQFDDEEKLLVEELLKTLDAHVNALVKENNTNEASIAEWLQTSVYTLSDILVKATNISPTDVEYIKQCIVARISYNAKFVSLKERNQDYLLGLPNQDCVAIKENEVLLLDWYKESEGLFSAETDSGMDGFIKLLDFVSRLSICNKWRLKKAHSKTSQLSLGLSVPDKKTIAQFDLLRLWLNGEEVENLLPYMQKIFPGKDFAEYREEILESNMAWGVSAICRYLNVTAENKGFSLAKDLDYLPSFVKYGVNTKNACQLMRLQIQRVDSAKISNLYKEKLKAVQVEVDEEPTFGNDFDEAIKSLDALDNKDFEALKVSVETIKRVEEIKKKYEIKAVVASDTSSFYFDPTDIEFSDDLEY